MAACAGTLAGNTLLESGISISAIGAFVGAPGASPKALIAGKAGGLVEAELAGADARFAFSGAALEVAIGTGCQTLVLVKVKALRASETLEGIDAVEAGSHARLTKLGGCTDDAGVIGVRARGQAAAIGDHVVVDCAIVDAFVAGDILGLLAHLAQFCVEAAETSIRALLHSYQEFHQPDGG